MSRLQLLVLGICVVCVTIFLSMYADTTRSMLTHTEEVQAEVKHMKSDMQLLASQMNIFFSESSKATSDLVRAVRQYSSQIEKTLQQINDNTHENNEKFNDNFKTITENTNKILSNTNTINNNNNNNKNDKNDKNDNKPTCPPPYDVSPLIAELKTQFAEVTLKVEAIMDSISHLDLNDDSHDDVINGDVNNVVTGATEVKEVTEVTEAVTEAAAVDTSENFDETRVGNRPVDDQLHNPGRLKRTVVIGILASYSHLDRRDAIRDTWTQYLKGKDADSEWTYKFFLGKPVNASQWPEVQAEQQKHKDIIFLPYVDTYMNLTLKTMAIARWAVENYDFQFLMKLDDDSFLRVDWLMDEIKNVPTERYYAGITIPFRPDRDPKSIWYLSKDLYPSDDGPIIVTGPGYVMSHDCATFLAQKSTDPNLVVLPLEDVNTAIILNEMGVHGVGFPRFVPGACPCRKDMILSHWCGPKDFRRFYENSQAGRSMC